MSLAPAPNPPPPRDPRLQRAAAALARGDLAAADPLLRDWLAEHPADPDALRMRAELLGRRGRLGEAEAMLERALVAAPDFAAARFNYAVVLHRSGRSPAALAQIERLQQHDPRHPAYRNLKGAILARIGDHDRAIAEYSAVLADFPDNPRGWMSLGHALKTVGRSAEGTAAYARAVALQPGLGEAWWSLANMKTHRFAAADVAAMLAALAEPTLAPDDRLHLDFALGKALEDQGEYEASFRHYAAGNARRRAQITWDGPRNHAHRVKNQELFTADFFAARAGQGCAAADPIFVVGLPRSGSTLIEQILSSHSQVEGTMELPDIAALARGLAESNPSPQGLGYLGALAAAGPDKLRGLGEAYLASTRSQRKTDRPRFVDKMPNNFAYAALIHLALPNATIIDARRHPMATCFSAWKQHFARGQAYTYELGELGRFYVDYVALMDHFDRVLPGRILRVDHEALVGDTEAQVRRLLAHCGLEFEAGCLAFHENTRPVRTASSEQVRRPITSAGLDQWKHYAPWLGELQAALAPILHR